MHGYSYSLPPLSHSLTQPLTHPLTQPLSQSKCIKLQTTAAKQKFQPTQSTHPSGLAVRPVVTVTFCDTLICRVVCRNADKSTFVLSLITLADQPHKYFFSFSFFFGFALVGLPFLVDISIFLIRGVFVSYSLISVSLFELSHQK